MSESTKVDPFETVGMTIVPATEGAEPLPKTVPGEVFRHFKGNQYVAELLGRDANSGKWVVIYRRATVDEVGEGGVPYDNRTLFWVRPADDFESEVDREDYKGPRFKFEKVVPSLKLISPRFERAWQNEAFAHQSTNEKLIAATERLTEAGELLDKANDRIAELEKELTFERDCNRIHCANIEAHLREIESLRSGNAVHVGDIQMRQQKINELAEVIQQYELGKILRDSQIEALSRELNNRAAEVDDFKAASMLNDSSGDPGTIRPEHVERHVTMLVGENELLKADNEALKAEAEKFSEVCANLRHTIEVLEERIRVIGLDHDVLSFEKAEYREQVKAVQSKLASALMEFEKVRKDAEYYRQEWHKALEEGKASKTLSGRIPSLLSIGKALREAVKTRNAVLDKVRNYIALRLVTEGNKSPEASALRGMLNEVETALAGVLPSEQEVAAAVVAVPVED